MLLTMAFRNIFRKPFRSLLCLVTIMLAVFTLTFLFSMIGGLRLDMGNNIKDYTSGEVAIQHVDAEKYERQNPLGFQVNGSEAMLSRLESLEGVNHALPRIPFNVLLSQNGKNTAIQGMGMDFAREDQAWDLGSYLIEGRFPTPGSKEVVMAASLANTVGLSMGEKFTFMTSTGRRTTNAITLQIVGLAHFNLPAWNTKYFLMPIERTKDFLKMDDNVVQILLRGDVPAADLKTTVEEAGIFGEDVVLNRWDQGNFLFDMMQLAEFIYAIMGVLFVGIGSTVIATTMMMVITERIKEIGTLGAIGMKPKELVNLFFTEALIIGTAATVFGIGFGLLTTNVAMGGFLDISSALEGVDFGVSGKVPLQIHPLSLLLVAGLGIVVSGVTSYLPSRRAAKIVPVEALRTI
jgi:putative ABC transport system permease protein